jgi:protoporphyrinogen oxidase
MDDSAASAVDRWVVGAGLRGLAAALRARRDGQQTGVIERLASPGGSARTQRTEGFACELGPVALGADELAPVLAALATPPPLVGPSTDFGWRWNGALLERVAVDGDARTGRTGIEDLVVAMRRELGSDLRLGCAVAQMTPTADGWSLRLDREVAAEVRAAHVRLCVPVAEAARLLSPFDPRLPPVAARLRSEPRAFVFLGTWADDAWRSACAGYGILVDDPASPLAEAIHCSNAFPNRAIAGKALVRLEVAGDAARDAEAAAAAAESELRRIAGWSGRVLFRRVHAFTVASRDAAWVECRVRLSDLCRQAPGLAID